MAYGGEEYNNLPLLSVTGIRMCSEENGPAHRTSDYDLMKRRDAEQRLVVRRGQSFYVDVDLSRNYDASLDGISIAMRFTSRIPDIPSDKFNFVEEVNDSGYVSGTSRQATVNSLGEKSMRIEIVASADCVVGEWQLGFVTRWKQEINGTSWEVYQRLYIIFNPWCIDDAVYLNDLEQLQEYVLNDKGLIWQGDTQNRYPKPWNFEQFEENILSEVVLLLYTVGNTDPASGGNPVIVCRNFTAAVNAEEERGMIFGKWHEPYDDGVLPMDWEGSGAIIRQYPKQGTVKYGQCWVYAGVLTTICRALGIPCRPVTNFASAHDIHVNLTVDEVIDEQGNRLEMADNKDTVWNFHVWNEAWMSRPDLKKPNDDTDYGGWQVIDGTPQELSNKMHRCGPASVTAVRTGKVQLDYDTNFVYSEVNADIIKWVKRDGHLVIKSIIQNEVGQFISTKVPGKPECDDITSAYKPSEWTPEERELVQEALKNCRNGRYDELVLQGLASDEVA